MKTHSGEVTFDLKPEEKSRKNWGKIQGEGTKILGGEDPKNRRNQGKSKTTGHHQPGNGDKCDLEGKEFALDQNSRFHPIIPESQGSQNLKQLGT